MAARHLALEGCLNLRDLGGYGTGDGREVRWGCLFRSDELCSLTDDDLDAVARLGVRVVVDLRNQWERAARPNRLPFGVEVIERTSPSSGSGPAPTLEEFIASGEVPRKDDAYITGVYLDLLERLTPEIRVVLERAADAVERPMLFHCAAGKDRTGVVAAVLLGVLGLPDDRIIEDYELTTDLYGIPRLERLAGLLTEHGLEPEAVRHLVEARTPALTGCLRHLHETWGSYDAYAVDAVGVDPDLPERLRAILTVRTG